MADPDFDDEAEEYVVYGTPLKEEEESRAGQRQKPVSDPALTKQLPVWQQEVTDEEGRRRFHGAFTGGYSAGYYNTVGSQQGWVPSAFTSSRSQRAGARQQAAEDFMDEDELAEAGRHKVQARREYDTFGDAALAQARAIAASEAAAHASAVPGAVPDELIAPVPQSVGIRMLERMGWRQGKGVGAAQAAAAERPGSRWGAEAGVGAKNVPIYLLEPKQDTHGLGFDAFKGAEEFRAAAERARTGKAARAGPRGGAPGVGGPRARGVAFGSGVLDEDDTYGMMEDYVTANAGDRSQYAFEEAGDDDDAAPGPRAQAASGYQLPGRAAPLALQSAGQVAQRVAGLVPGFVKAAEVVTLPMYPGPIIPPGYEPVHRIPVPPATPGSSAGGAVAAAGPAPPVDPQLRRTLETLAAFVARVGPAFEASVKQRNASAPGFAFLSGGEGSEYYRWRGEDAYMKSNCSSPIRRVALLRTAAAQAASALGGATTISRRAVPLLADARGALLGETSLPGDGPGPPAMPALPLDVPATAPRRPDLSAIAEGDRSRLQAVLAANFTPQASGEAGAGTGDGGLRAGAPARAPFTAARPPSAGPAPAAPSAAEQWAAQMAVRFASSATAEKLPGAELPGGLSVPAAQPAPRPERDPPCAAHTVEEWRPEPLVCRRYNVPDPYKGRAPQARPRVSLTDSLTLTETAAAALAAAPGFAHLPAPPPAAPAILPLPADALPPQPPTTEGSAADTAVSSAAQPKDSRSLADAFLSELGAVEEEGGRKLPPPPAMPGRPPEGTQGSATTAGGSDAALPVPPPYVEKPLDLFKAIFEAENSSSDDDDEPNPDTRNALDSAQRNAKALPARDPADGRGNTLPAAGIAGPAERGDHRELAAPPEALERTPQQDVGRPSGHAQPAAAGLPLTSVWKGGTSEDRRGHAKEAKAVGPQDGNLTKVQLPLREKKVKRKRERDLKKTNSKKRHKSKHKKAKKAKAVDKQINVSSSDSDSV